MWIISFVVVFCLVMLFVCLKARCIPKPKLTDNQKKQLKQKSKKIEAVTAFLRKSPYSFYELYASGSSFERAYEMGVVLKDLKETHEKLFIDSVYQIIPSKIQLQFLKWLVAFLNRNLYKYFKKEYLEELYAMSFSSSNNFDYIAPKYVRVLNYHAAHDIGHALQNMGLVGCSSFIVRNEKSEDGTLMLARNLDFSPSKGFNKLKVLYFIKPSNGYKFVSYSWPGFIGVVSAMNDKGLSVVLHSAKSKMSLKIGTPVSIIAREIVQEAKNLQEAREILKKRTPFVSEFFIVASAMDKSCIMFERTPKSLTEYEMSGDEMICTNHFLSSEKRNTKENIEWKNQISSAYREERMKELLEKYSKISPDNAAEILRDVRGLNDENIGLQNENAINQLAAHHGIIFKPETKEFWVASSPYMMGEMVYYNLEEMFKKFEQGEQSEIYKAVKNIKEDSFLYIKEYSLFLEYEKLKSIIQKAIKAKKRITKEVLDSFLNSNKNLYTTYMILGDYYKSQNKKKLAKESYNKALKKNIPTTFEKNRIQQKIKAL